MIRRCCYAHGQYLYGTPQEKRDVALLKSLSCKEVVNPGDPEVQDDQLFWTESRPVGGPMDYGLSLVADCDALAFRAFPNGVIPAGVGKEIEKALELAMVVIELPSLVSTRVMSVEQTRELLSGLGRR